MAVNRGPVTRRDWVVTCGVVRRGEAREFSSIEPGALLLDFSPVESFQSVGAISKHMRVSCVARRGKQGDETA